MDESSAITQSLDTVQRKELEKRLRAQSGDLILFGVDCVGVVNRALGRLRKLLAENLDLIDKVCVYIVVHLVTIRQSLRFTGKRMVLCHVGRELTHTGLGCFN